MPAFANPAVASCNLHYTYSRLGTQSPARQEKTGRLTTVRHATGQTGRWRVSQGPSLAVRCFCARGRKHGQAGSPPHAAAGAAIAPVHKKHSPLPRLRQKKWSGVNAIRPFVTSHYYTISYHVNNFLITALITPQNAAFQAVRGPLGPQISPSAGDMPSARGPKARSAIIPTTFCLDCR